LSSSSAACAESYWEESSVEVSWKAVDDGGFRCGAMYFYRVRKLCGVQHRQCYPLTLASAPNPYMTPPETTAMIFQSQ
jgi:hypothetical protein